MLKVVEATGDYRECGRAFGLACKESIAYRLDREVSLAALEKHRAELVEVNERCKKWYPEYVEELEGITEGSGADYWRLLLLNTPEIMERESGCTSIAVSAEDKLYLVHNEDGGSDERTEDCVLLHYTLPTVSFYTFTYAGEIAGGSYSWNSHHLYFSVNYLKPIELDVTDRVSRNFVARKVIEATSVEDAISILKNSHDICGYHYYLGQGEKLFTIENFHNEVSAREVRGVEAHSNHYLHPQFAGRVAHKQHTEVRLNRAQELIKEGAEPLQILADRENAPLSICTEPNEALHTISTIGFFPKEQKVILYEPESLKKEATFKL
ncbi:MAG: C45 family peptidase [Patescibacteria group bacterium]